MKSDLHLRRAAPPTRLLHGRIAPGVTRFALPAVALLAFVVSALVTGAAFATAAELVPVTLPVLLVARIGAIGATFALPLVGVRAAVALLERYQ
jgi:hypothetical protein